MVAGVIVAVHQVRVQLQEIIVAVVNFTFLRSVSVRLVMMVKWSWGIDRTAKNTHTAPTMLMIEPLLCCARSCKLMAKIWEFGQNNALAVFYYFNMCRRFFLTLYSCWHDGRWWLSVITISWGGGGVLFPSAIICWKRLCCLLMTVTIIAFVVVVVEDCFTHFTNTY